MIMGAVNGHFHDIGKNLVIMMIESDGFEVINLGIDVPVSKFVEMASDLAVKIVGVSALLTTTMPVMAETVAAMNAMPNRIQFKIMVGGVSVASEFADEIGADAYTINVASAAQKAKEFAQIAP